MLRLGCVGCLTVVGFVGLVIGAAWSVFQITRAPAVATTSTTVADSHQAQQKIFDLIRRAKEGKVHTASLSESEVNAFLRRNVAAPDLPLRTPTVRLQPDDRAEIMGLIPLRDLMTMPPFSALGSVLPQPWLDHEVWLTVRSRVTVERSGGTRTSRRLRLDVERFWLGRLPLPEIVLRLIFDPAVLRFLRWPLPEAIGGIRVESGRVLILTGS